jgi:pantetheine-phosphate adenylyltransferase
MSVTVAVLPASFDPITNGHVDIVRRAAHLFGQLYVAVYANPKKKVLFPLEERLIMVREAVGDVPGVEIMYYRGLTVDLCRELGATVLVRGLRAVSDFEYEYQQAALNRVMLPGLEVVSMFASDVLGFVSSSLIKEIAENGGDVSALVPPSVAARLRQRFVRTPSSTAVGG